MKDKILIEIKKLSKHFNIGNKRVLKAVEDIDINIYRGETLGIVGESGCGKTTLGRTIINLYKPTKGKILYDGVDINSLKGKEIKKFKKSAQMIFQDPYASLDPKMTIGDIIEEGLNVHFKNLTKEEKRDKVTELLHTVGLNAEHAARFPRELSGGQRQRVGIARALAIEPDFIVCDEPISALDVSIQAQVVNLLIELQKKKKLTYLFISHDLSMIKHISDRIGVMYLGSLVELSPSNSLYKKPLHPYTQTLISAIPIPDPSVKSENRIKLEGEIPSPIDLPKGCKFSTRCRYASELCKEKRPELVELEAEHFVACHLYNKK